MQVTLSKREKGTKKKELLKLDLACGQSKREGFIGVDRVKVAGVDRVVDLTKYPWPFENESCEELHCSHYVEHVQDIIGFMEECYRILVPGGKIHIVAPYARSSRAYQDPTHVRMIGEECFLYYNKGWRDANKLDHYGIRSDFDFTYGYNFFPDWATKSDDARAFALKHYWNVVADIFVTLTKR